MFLQYGSAGIYEKEIFIGTYGTTAFIALQYYFEKYIIKKRALLVVDALMLLLCIPPVITYVHYIIYGYPIIYEEMWLFITPILEKLWNGQCLMLDGEISY